MKSSVVFEVYFLIKKINVIWELPEVLLLCYAISDAIENLVEAAMFKREARQLCRKLNESFCVMYTEMTGEVLELKCS